MARLLLLADSNFQNNIGEYSGRKIKNLEFKSCQTRKAVMSELSGVEEGIVVVSCLDMIAADIVKTTPQGAEQAVELYYNQLVYKLVDRADEADGKLAFGVMAPLFWSSLPVTVRRAMNHVYKTLKTTPMNNVWISDPIKNVWAGADGTHLTGNSAKHYIRQIQDFAVKIESASKVKCIEFDSTPEGDPGMDWNEEMVASDIDKEAVNILVAPGDQDLPPPERSGTSSGSILAPPRLNFPADDTQQRLMRLASPIPFPDMSIPPPGSTNSGRRTPQPETEEVSLNSLARRVGALEAKTFYDNLTTASLKEELDSEANKAMLNKVTFSGVVIPGLEGLNDTDKIRVMRAKVQEIIELLQEPNQEFEVQFVKHLNKQVKGQKTSVLEVRFANSQQAMGLRAEFAKKQKTVTLPSKVNITPVVRLATRVRIEMMHSIANLIKQHDRAVTRAMCLQYIPKPVIKLSYKSAAGEDYSRSMSFIEAISWVKENGYQQTIDLKKARDRAGASFRSTLSQNFVLLD